MKGYHLTHKRMGQLVGHNKATKQRDNGGLLRIPPQQTDHSAYPYSTADWYRWEVNAWARL